MFGVIFALVLLYWSIVFTVVPEFKRIADALEKLVENMETED